MAASATRNEELWRKLQLKYEIPIYAIKPHFRKFVAAGTFLSSAGVTTELLPACLTLHDFILCHFFVFLLVCTTMTMKFVE